MCAICEDKLTNQSTKPSKLLQHLKTNYPTLKDKLVKHFEQKQQQQPGQQQLLKRATIINMAALKVLFMVADQIVKAKKPFTIEEELILPAANNICHEMLDETAASKIGHVLLSASTVTRRMEYIAGNIDMQLLPRVNKSPWYLLQVDKSTDVEQQGCSSAYMK